MSQTDRQTKAFLCMGTIKKISMLGRNTESVRRVNVVSVPAKARAGLDGGREAGDEGPGLASSSAGEGTGREREAYSPVGGAKVVAEGVEVADDGPRGGRGDVDEGRRGGRCNVSKR